MSRRARPSHAVATAVENIRRKKEDQTTAIAAKKEENLMFRLFLLLVFPFCVFGGEYHHHLLPPSVPVNNNYCLYIYIYIHTYIYMYPLHFSSPNVHSLLDCFRSCFLFGVYAGGRPSPTGVLLLHTKRKGPLACIFAPNRKNSKELSIAYVNVHSLVTLTSAVQPVRSMRGYASTPLLHFCPPLQHPLSLTRPVHVRRRLFESLRAASNIYFPSCRHQSETICALFVLLYP